ncbi:ATP-binding protein [Nitrospira sp. T9]|uniref:ATP-binding protein n=1 Tax=unclassified Nitrospira TaxID=2652172 RepID=UPI003F9E0F4D
MFSQTVVLPNSLDIGTFVQFLQENNIWNIEEPETPVMLETMGHRWIEPTPLAALAVALCERKNTHQAEIDLKNFKGAKHPGYFERMKFFDLLNQPSPVYPGVHHDPSGRFIELTVFNSLKEVDNLIRQAADLLGVDTFIAPFVTRALEEAMRNAVQHAGEGHLRLVVAQRYSSPPARIHLAIVDSGIGIRASLFDKCESVVGDAEKALRLSVQAGISGKRGKTTGNYFEQNQGFGLHLLNRIVEETYGRFVLATEDRLRFQDGIHTEFRKIKKINGTIMGIELFEDYLKGLNFYELQNRFIREVPW